MHPPSIHSRVSGAPFYGARRNARNLPCPDCGEPNKLTAADKARGYHCADCTRREEDGGCAW
jgi:hypothetical protein